MDDLSYTNLTFVEKKAVRELVNLKSQKPSVFIIGAQNLSFLLKVSRSRAYKILLSLTEKELLEKFERKGFILTKKGKLMINDLCYSKKVLEVFFTETLSLSSNNSSNDASDLCLFVNSRIISAIDKKFVHLNIDMESLSENLVAKL